MIRILAAGPLSTVQDAGRSGWAHVGVPAAGPADPVAHTLANRLVGNADGTAAVECTLSGPRLRFEQAVTIAVVGSSLEIDGVAAGSERPVAVRAGQTAQIGPCRRVRGYLAVAGGVGGPQVLGSRSTDILSGIGPPRLTEGAVVDCGAGTGADPADRCARFAYDESLRVITGPHADWFAEPLPEQGYVVDPRGDRVGIRLAGPAITRSRPGELPVEGMVTGAIQVPPDGQPIVLLPDHGVTGGYPVIAVVISADLHKLGQLPPGAELSFHPVDRDTARAAYRQLQQTIEAAITEGPAGSRTRGA